MLKHKIIWLMVALIIPIANAIEIQIADEKTVTKNIPTTLEIQVTNNHSFTVYNVTATSPESFITFGSIPAIPQNSIAVLNATINTQSAFEKIINFTITYNTVTQTVAQPASVSITVDTTILQPSNVSITKNSKIRWQTGAPQSFDVKKMDGTETLTIPAGSFVEKTFADISIYDFFIQQTGLVGQITITSDIIDVFTHSPDTDIKKFLNLRSLNEPSSLSVENLIPSFQMGYNQQEQGAIKLIGTGSVYDVILSASPNWLAFHQNNIDSFNGSKIITYSIIPQISNSNETNKTYPISIEIKSDNAPTINTTISVFINFAPEIVPNATQQGNVTVFFATDEQISAFCARFPEKCPTRIVEKTILTERNDTITLLIKEMNDRMQRFENREKLRDDTLLAYDTKFGELNGKVDSTIAQVASVDTFVKDRFRESSAVKIFFIIVGSIVFLGLSGFLGYKWFRSHEAKRAGDF